MRRERIVFFDRDGIVNERIEGGYLRSPDEFVFCDGFFPLFEWVKAAGFRAIIVSNQQGVAKGVMTQQQLEEVTAWMQQQLLRRTGTVFDDVFYCTELDTPEARCRKPRPTMLLEALEKWHADASRSWMIGDMPSDIEAAVGAGVRGILVGSYTAAEAPGAYAVVPDLHACLQLLKAAVSR